MAGINIEKVEEFFQTFKDMTPEQREGVNEVREFVGSEPVYLNDEEEGAAELREFLS